MKRLAVLVPVLSVGVSFVLASCGGPERAPRQPIPGVDHPHPGGTNPHDVLSGPGTQPFLGGFVDEVVAAHGAASGDVAVLPALTFNTETSKNHVNGLGEHLARETVLRLEKRGVGSLSGSDLVLEMHRSNLSVKYFASVADALEIARRIGARYVITGTAVHRVFNVQKRDEVLEIDWLCRKTEDGTTIARYHVVLPGGDLADELVRHYRKESEWDHNVRNEGFTPSDGN